LTQKKKSDLLIEITYWISPYHIWYVRYL